LTLAALEATLALYRDPARALREIPALAHLGATVPELRARAERLVSALAVAAVTVADTVASVGGGAFPTAEIPSVALSIPGDATRIEQRLRTGDPPLVARVANGRVLIDLRAIFPADDERLPALIRAAIE
jgi:L-seryl-tRNA(Ser) seleniumtransferase